LVIAGVKQIVTPVDNDPKVETVIESLAIAFPDFFGQPASFSNSLAISRVTTTSLICSNDNLFRQEITIDEALGLSYPDVFGAPPSFSNSLARLSKTTTQYFLREGIVYKTVLTEIEALAKSFPDFYGQSASFSNALATARITTKEWELVRDGLWDLTTTIDEALGLSYPDVFGAPPSFSNSLARLSSITTPDTIGPPTNIGDISLNTITEEQLTAQVFASQLAADSNRERQRTINLPYATSVPQLVAFGDLYNKFLSGRALGWQFGGAITNDSLTFAPFSQVAVTDGSTLYYLKIDAIQYAINQTSAYVLFNGIECGVANVATPSDISRPVTITLGSPRVSTVSSAIALFNEIRVAAISTESSARAFPAINSGAISTESEAIAIFETVASLNDKVIAYWKMDGETTIGFNIYIRDEVNPTSPDNALQSSGSYSSGLVGNAEGSGNDSPTDPSFHDPTTTDPELNGFDFIGVASWIRIEVNPLDLSPNTTYTSDFIDTRRYKVRVILETADPVDLATTTIDFAFGDAISIFAGFADSIDTWNLLTGEIDITLGTYSLRLNDNAKVTLAYTSNGLSQLGFSLRSQTNDFSTKIDESFIYNAPLSTDDVAEIYNSGAGTTYPFA
jgi:hypothetical protein